MQEDGGHHLKSMEISSSWHPREADSSKGSARQLNVPVVGSAIMYQDPGGEADKRQNFDPFKGTESAI